MGIYTTVIFIAALCFCRSLSAPLPPTPSPVVSPCLNTACKIATNLKNCACVPAVDQSKSEEKQQMDKSEKADANKIRKNGIRFEFRNDRYELRSSPSSPLPNLHDKSNSFGSGTHVPDQVSGRAEETNCWECRKYGHKCSSPCKPNGNWWLR